MITHVGDAEGVDPNQWGVLPQEKKKSKPGKGPLIQMEDEDVREIQEHQLKTVQEEGQRESSDEGDDDDY